MQIKENTFFEKNIKKKLLTFYLYFLKIYIKFLKKYDNLI